MSLGIVAGAGGYVIEENNAPNAYIRRDDGRYVLGTFTGGAWITRSGVAYSLDFAGQDFMAVTHAIVTVSSSAVALNTAGPVGATLTLKNTSANAADLGTSTVTAAGGFSLAAGATVTVALKPGDVLYAIRTASSDATIAVLRT